MNIIDADFLIVRPTLEYLRPIAPPTPEAQILLLAIGITESNFSTRMQVGGPAVGFWQFEMGGGCAEFELSPKLTRFRAAALELGFKSDRGATYRSLQSGADHLACLMARSLIWLQPDPLPSLGDPVEAYRQYLLRWRPGKPSMKRFLAAHARAMDYAMDGNASLVS